MKEKILYSSAIIPDNLYVKRDADNKLKEIILRMSKPAYISVARQMGKTNLLIQAKRELENNSTRVVYIDITNKFETAQECFRYIVNQILNSNEDIAEFIEAKEIIDNKRLTSYSNPTEEYQNEIKEILKKFRGNLVVFLDEVDDLRKHAFSDDIFGQVRKTYFIRETYPVLKRITYVLSGVIDPEKLIKTKENSPFNIAIPIYLEDFNLGEFYELINKSQIILDNEVKEYVFDWLKGNPRMSFEILSLIEDEFINETEITKELVDRIITDFYLTTFKNPPIDHIRDLTRHNTDVRKALIKLRNGHVNELSDDIINKLYLYGITASKINKHNLTIKNRVIDLCLSDEWLENVALEKKGYYELGSEKIKNGKIEDGIELLKEYISNEPKGKYAALSKYEIGKAYHSLRDYELSNQFLIQLPITKEQSSDLYFWQIYHIGANYLNLSKFNESLKCFNEIINDGINPETVISGYVNKGESMINLKSSINEIEVLYTLAIKYIEDNQESISNINSLLSIIYYRLGFIYVQNKIKDKALQHFEKALETADEFEKITILLFIDSCYEENIEKRTSIYSELTKYIVDRNIRYSEKPAIITHLNEYQLILILANSFEFKLVDEFNALLNYSMHSIYNNETNEYELIFKIGIFAINNNSIDVGEELFLKALKYSNIDENIERSCNKYLGLIFHSKKDFKNSINYLSRYIELFDKNIDDTLEANDFNAFIALIEYYRLNKEFEKSLEVASIIEKRFDDNLNSDSMISSIMIQFYIMDYYAFNGSLEKIKYYGNTILSNISNIKTVLNNLSNSDRKVISNIESQTNLVLKKFTQIKPIETIKVNREPGRNEYVKVKYKDGKTIDVKYKKVIEDIRRGDCMIIN
jgi:Uncharacterized protein conserved in bacteria